MAYEILRQNKFPLDIDPAAGNDFDTILLINPQLEPTAFNALLTELREAIFSISKGTISDVSLRGSVLGALDSNGMAIANKPDGYKYDTQPFIITREDDYGVREISMNISLISIFLNIDIPGKPGYWTKIIDITIPLRHYKLLQFDYALYSMPGRVIDVPINRQLIYIADFLSILFDQSVTKKLNVYATENKIARRNARIRNINTRTRTGTTGTNRNAIVTRIAPYLNNSILNGFVANGIVPTYRKGLAKANAIPPPPPSYSSSSASSAASSAPSSDPRITIAEAATRLATPKVNEVVLSPFMAALFKRKEEVAAAKAAAEAEAAAAKGST
jgi:hypothetical protein